MRTKRILSLVLAIAMLASLTISASATQSKVYLVEDFDNYADYEEWFATTKVVSSTSWPATAADLATYKELGSKVWTNNAAYSTPGSSQTTLNKNAEGTNQLFATTKYSSGNDFAFFFDSWDATTNTDETFVVEVTYDGTNATTSNSASNILTLVGETGNRHTLFGVYSGGWKAATTSNGYSGTALAWGDNLVRDYVYAVQYDSEKAKTLKTTIEDGKIIQNKADVAVTNSLTKVEGISLYLAGKIGLGFADIKAYTLKITPNAFNVTRTTGGDVPVTGGTIPVKFSQPVEASTYDADAVTITGTNETGTITLENGTDFEVTDVTEVIAGEEIYSTAEIVFLTELAESTEYTITFPGAIKNTIATALEGYNTITFSTPTPEVKIANFNIVNAWGTEFEAVSANDYFLANNTLQGAALSLTNTTADPINNIAVIYAVYAEGGKLTDVVYANDSIAASATAEIGAGVTLSKEGTVKAFVWNGIDSMNPHTKATVKEIKAQ